MDCFRLAVFSVWAFDTASNGQNREYYPASSRLCVTSLRGAGLTFDDSLRGLADDHQRKIGLEAKQSSICVYCGGICDVSKPSKYLQTSVRCVVERPFKKHGSLAHRASVMHTPLSEVVHDAKTRGAKRFCSRARNAHHIPQSRKPRRGGSYPSRCDQDRDWTTSQRAQTHMHTRVHTRTHKHIPAMNNPTNLGAQPRDSLKNKGAPISNQTSRDANRKNLAADSMLTLRPFLNSPAQSIFFAAEMPKPLKINTPANAHSEAESGERRRDLSPDESISVRKLSVKTVHRTSLTNS